jgi:hypothetical protein
MTQRLKRWESPRREGRNDKGKGGSARARQLKKRQQMLRKKLQEGQQADDQNRKKGNQNQQKGRDSSSLPLFFGMMERSPLLIIKNVRSKRAIADLLRLTTLYS